MMCAICHWQQKKKKKTKGIVIGFVVVKEPIV